MTDPTLWRNAELPAATAAETLRIGEWIVEPALHQLSAEGRILKIEPKAMAVLCHLARRPGQVVSRDSLLSSVWSGVIVGDDALTQVVVKLRKALGDDPDTPAYIQTIQKGGYRLVAPVACPPASAQVRSTLDSARADRETRRRWLGGGAAALLVSAAVVWWMAGERAAGSLTPGSVTSGGRSAVTTQPTVAVKPFEPVGNDPQEALLARGVTADLVTDLSKMSGLWVVRVAPPDERTGAEVAADAVPVRYFVSGTVQRGGERIRLHVHLTEAETGKQLWSERFDRALGGIFEVQDELAPRILELLPVKVSEAEKRRVAQRHTRNLEAYEIFQRGQLSVQARRKTENEAAREMFHRAIALDAAFARAYAGLAMTYTAEYRNQWASDGAAALERAFQLAHTARQINPDIPETYWVLAFVHSHRREHDQAVRHLDTALRLHPSFADGYALKGAIYTSTGRPAEGVTLLHTAIRLAPESGYTYLMLLGRAYLALGQLEQAQINLNHALARNPEFLDARVYMAAAHLAAGDRAAAAWEAEEIRALQPDFTVRRWLETNPTANGAFKAKLVESLAQLGF